MQKTIKYLKYFLWPILTITAIIEAFSIATIIPRSLTYLGTLLIIFFWTIIEVRSRTKGIPWKGDFAKNLKVIKPSIYMRVSVLGLLFVFWIPFFVGKKDENNELEEYKEHVEILLLSKETGLKEERLKEILSHLWGDNYLDKLKDENSFQNLLSSVKGRTLVEILDEFKTYEKITFYDPKLKNRVLQSLYNFHFEESMKLIDKYIQEHPNLKREHWAQIEYLRSIVLNVQGDYFGAEKSLRVAVTLDNDNPDLNYKYGLILSFIGENIDALDYFRKAHTGYSNAKTKNLGKLALVSFRIGFAYEELGNDDLAMNYLDKALEYGNDVNPIEYECHKVFMEKAFIYVRRRDFEKGEEFLEKAKKIVLGNYSSPSYELGKLYMGFGIMWSDRGNIDLAIENYNMAFTEMIPTIGINHPTVADLHHNIAVEFQKKIIPYNVEKAMYHYDKAIEITKNTIGEDHFKLALTYKDKGILLDKTGNYFEAHKYYNKALVIMIRSLPEHHPEIIEVRRLIRQNRGE